MRALTSRNKKLIGAIFMLIWLPIYALVAMRVGLAMLPDAGTLPVLVYYAIAGTAWIIPIGLALPWMHRDARLKDGRSA